jgi:hypothetical protein
MKKSLMLIALSAPLVIGGWVFAGPGTPTATPRPTPTPRAMPVAPTPPTPPTPPDHWGSNVNVHLDLGGIKDIVRDALIAARTGIAKDKNIPADVRSAVLARLDKVQSVITKRTANLDLSDLSNLDKQLSGLDAELNSALAGMDQEMAALTKKYGKNFSKAFNFNWSKDFKNWNGNVHLGKVNVDFNSSTDDDDHDNDIADNDPSNDDQDSDDDHDDDVGDATDVDVAAAAGLDADDLNDAVDQLDDFGVDKDQRAKLSQLRNDERSTSGAAKTRLEKASNALRAELAKTDANPTEVNRLVDQISTEEANIRKAQLKALLGAKAVLKADQQKKVQDAAKKARHK